MDTLVIDRAQASRWSMAVPVVVAAVWGPTRVVVGLAILSVLMALVSGMSNAYFATLNDMLWMGAMVLVGAAAVAAELRERTRAQRDAASSMLRAALDAAFDPHVFLKALRDRAGQIVDFEYADANPAACAEPITLRGECIRATVSIGVTLSNPIERGVDMVAQADRAMYEAKASGRNAVVAIPARTPVRR